MKTADLRKEWIKGWKRWVRFGGEEECQSAAELAGFNRAAKANEMLETGDRPTSAQASEFCPYAEGGCPGCGHTDHEGLTCHHVSGVEEPEYCDCHRDGEDA